MVSRLPRRLTILAATVFLLVMTATPAQAQHEHTISVPISIGPLTLKIALLYAVPAVAGFALLRGFLGAPSRRTAAFVCSGAAVAVVMELILAGKLDVPNQVAFLAFVAGVFPAFHAIAPVSRPLDPHVVRIAPFVLVTAGSVACVELVRAWSGGGTQLLHSGVILAVAGLAWLPLVGSPGRVVRFAVFPAAGLLALALLAAATQATVAAGF
ncbi:DUF6239 family natural product biosynthesis protein [Actinokineospora sp. HUAS TT18]|uniref:DUF6239 family natural product biosynthesis protein n=1 Tax=Actinokineospora sp. HUAS TT18 TaxID=3447451 RepID=UPI003F526055